MREICVDIWNNIRVFIIIVQKSGESDPVKIVGCSYYIIAVFVRETWYSVNKCLKRFLNENNIEVFICFQNVVYKSSVLTNILQKNLDIF